MSSAVAATEGIPADRIVGAREVREILGVDKSTLSRWQRDGYLPDPITRLAAGPLWDRAAIDEFAARHRSTADAAGRRGQATTPDPE